MNDAGRKYCLFFVFLIFLFLGGCAGRLQPPVAPGDRLLVDYKCFTGGGELAASTFAENKEEKSPIFRRMIRPGPVKLTAGPTPECPDCNKFERSFLQVLHEVMQEELAGGNADEQLHLVLRTNELLADEAEGTITLPRRDFRKRQRIVQKEPLEKRLGRPLEPGDIISSTEPDIFSLKVIDIRLDKALVELLPESRKIFRTPFGVADVTETDKGFELYIRPQTGYLVKSGGWIGRLVDFDDETMLFDYRHPFGYEELQCDVWVRQPVTDTEVGVQAPTP